MYFTNQIVLELVSLKNIFLKTFTWVPGLSLHSHQDKEEDKSSPLFFQLKIAPDILVL